jgi:hypothetical protein
MFSKRKGKGRWWAVAVIVLCTIGLSTGIFKYRGFWTSYVLDIVGPAWNYILVRGLYLPKEPTGLQRHFTAEITAGSIILICFLIEISQYFELYDAHFDPYDFVAYTSGVLPCYLADKWFARSKTKRKMV